MTALLIVPVHLDALHLPEDRYTTEPTADFTRLPYVDPITGQDVHADLPYLSEIILSQPFRDQRLRLKAGVHLHWALPDALTHAEQQDGKTSFHAVPNRWLVTRSRDDTLEEQWIVESDFLSDDDATGISYPYIPEQMTGPSPRPFRYLGRKLPLSAWSPSNDRSRYLTQLTAVGYGEPTFAAFYPNCHSVFGFHDPDYADDIPAGLRYEIIGWYSDSGQDALSIRLRLPRDGHSWQEAIQALGWTAREQDPLPERMVCYGQITFAPELSANPLLADTESGVSVGNTATEALAAHLGAVIEGVDEDELENLVEALAFADHLEQKQIDVGAKLVEARHGNTFRPVPAGLLWTIRREDRTGGASPNVLLADQRQTIVLPQDLADKLNLLNIAQDAYDRACRELGAMREQIFVDWYKYMLCVYPETSRESYPNPDEVMFFIRRNIGNLQARVAAIGALKDRCDSAWQETDDALNETNNALLGAKTEYVLQQIAAPQFYSPVEPVVLLTGDVATPTDRHGQDGRMHPDGLLKCYGLKSDDERLGFGTSEGLRALHQHVAGFFAALDEPSIAVDTWHYQPWHPILLQWEVEFFPVSYSNDRKSEDRSYHADFIIENYLLDEQQVELQLRPESKNLGKGANTYSGTSILSPVAKTVLDDRILTYLEKHVLPEYYEAHQTPAEARQVEEFRRNPDPVLEWYGSSGEDATFKILIRVYNHLRSHGGSNLSQLLAGFNDALLMKKVTRQLPIADPLGFEPYKTFTERDVRDAVGAFMTRAPQPLHDFNPIRAGAVRILQLRVVDTFGIVHDIDVTRSTTTAQMRLPEYPDWVALPPRLIQPARINFRWLDSDHDIQEMNNLPETSPICGWLLPNNLDANIAVYDQEGRGLGVLSAPADRDAHDPARWHPLPGSPAAVGIDEIGNPHLRKVAQHLRDAGADYVGSFIEAIDTALATIEPEDYAQHRSQALLMGRPVAVVRAQLDLQLIERPAIHQDWNVFRLDMHRSTRETNNFTQVLFPIRLGEHHQLNDGLIGYWLENASLELGEEFHAVHGDPTNIPQAIDAPPQYLTMLVDPRGVVHATSGILPTKAIGIPPEHYRDALQNIEVSFFSAPVLTDADQLDLPLPNEAGYVWSWLQRDREGWQEISTSPTIRRAAFEAGFGAEEGEAIWSELIGVGWLTPVGDETAVIAPPEQRTTALSEQRAAERERIEVLLEQPAIDVPRAQAHFLARPTVRDGWLKLRSVPDRT